MRDVEQESPNVKAQPRFMAGDILRPLASSFAFLAMSWPAVTFAQGFDANQYQPTPVASDGLAVARPTALEHGALGVVGTLSYAHDPLISRVRAQDGTVIDDRTIIGHQVYGFFGLAYGLWDALTLHATLPLAILQSGPEPAGSGIAPSSTALGDLRLGARLRLLGGLEGDNPSRFGLALDTSVFLPTGSRDAFASDGKVRVQPSLIAEVLPVDSLYVGANAGVMARPKSEMAGANIGSDFHLAGSAGFRTERDRLRLGIEASSKTRLDATAFEGPASAVETLGVASMRFLDGGLIASLGAGPGFSSAPGSPDFRAIARIGWAPNAERNHAPAPEPAPVPVSEPEPEPSDRDEDGIVDTEDACPDVAGVAHDDPAKNGCPADRDNDGIADSEDACPDVAGVQSDDPQLNGCPPVKVTEKAIEITEQVHFEFGLATLRSESDSTLKSIAKALRDNPDIQKLSIEGHTDERGSDALNLNLSRARAEAVRAWLVAHGIEAERLSTKGFGKTRPIADNATDEGRERNRRVEFNITARAKKP